MATSHFCNGKWRAGSVADCDRHRRLDRKQATVYNRSAESPPPSGGSKESSASSSPASGSGDG